MNCKASNVLTRDSLFKPLEETLRYQYTKIEVKTEIHVLEIWPPDPTHPEILSGELVTVRLENKPEFEALSYIWSEPIFNHQLQSGHIS